MNEQGILQGSYDPSEAQKMFHDTIGHMCMRDPLKPLPHNTTYVSQSTPHYPRRWFKHLCHVQVTTSFAQTRINKCCIRWIVFLGEWNRTCWRTHRYIDFRGIEFDTRDADHDQLSRHSYWPVIYITGMVWCRITRFVIG